MDDDKKAAIAANKEAWNAAAAHHKAAAQWQALRDGFAKPGHSVLDDIESRILADIGIAGKAVAQLCCNNGRELLSLKNLGAGRCVGFDQAEEFLAQGRELAALAGQELEFVAGNVLEVPAAYDGRFDLVTTTIGVFGWMPDLPAFMAVVARLLKPGGAYFAYEEHPILNMLEPESAAPHLPKNSYFKAEPFVETAGLDYFGGAKYEAPTSYWYAHTLSAILTAGLANGLALERIAEYEHNITAPEFAIYENQPAQYPLCFTMVLRKPA